MKRIALMVMVAAVILTGLLTWSNNPAYACSCALLDTSKKLEQSSAVFQGKVVSRGGTQKFQHGVLRKYSLEIDQAWKGVDTKKLTLYSYDGASASCGYSFDVNQTYLVYAYMGEGRLQTNLCSGNQLLSSAGEDLKVLGVGTEIHSDLEDSSSVVSGSTRKILLVTAVGLIVVGSASVWWVRRRRSR